MKLLAGIFLISFCFLSDANAGIEAKVFGGFLSPDPKGLNSQLGGNNITKIYLMGVTGAEGIFKFQSGLGLGVRYDWQGIKVGDGGNEVEASSIRWSGVVVFRGIDGAGFLGFIGTYGLSHVPRIAYKVNNSTDHYDSGVGSSISGGIEGGFNLGGLMAGLEFGAQSYLIKDIKGSGGNAPFDLNLGGFYLNVKAGFGF